MCFNIFKEARFKTAKQDLTVYKVVRKGDTSMEARAWFYDHTYILGNEYSVTMDDIDISVVRTKHRKMFNKGFHSYLGSAVGEIYVEALERRVNSSHLSGAYLAEFTIPKGSKYMVNENGEVFSNKIIFSGFITYSDIDFNQTKL